MVTSLIMRAASNNNVAVFFHEDCYRGHIFMMMTAAHNKDATMILVLVLRTVTISSVTVLFPYKNQALLKSKSGHKS